MSKWAESDSETEEEEEVEEQQAEESVPAVAESTPSPMVRSSSSMSMNTPYTVSREASLSPAPYSSAPRSPTPRVPESAGNNTTAHVSGLRDFRESEDVLAFFTRNGVNVLRADPLSSKDRAGYTRGVVSWIVECTDPDNLQLILNMNGQSIDRCSLTTRVFEVRNDRNNHRNNNRSNNYNNSSNNREGRDYGRGDRRQRDGHHQTETSQTDIDRERENRGREFRERRDRQQALHVESSTSALTSSSPPLVTPPSRPSQADIFGGAKPRDEKEYEERRKRLLEEKAQREAEKMASTFTSSLTIEAPVDEEQPAVEAAAQVDEAAGSSPIDGKKSSRTSRNHSKEKTPRNREQNKDHAHQQSQVRREKSTSPMPEESAVEKTSKFHGKEQRDSRPHGKNNNRREKKDKKEEVAAVEEDDDFVTVKRDNSKPVRKGGAQSPKEQAASPLPPKESSGTKLIKSVPTKSRTVFAVLDSSDDE